MKNEPLAFERGVIFLGVANLLKPYQLILAGKYCAINFL
jgi:hypothetical protein